jgi:chemotaxis signal transduction protein
MQIGLTVDGVQEVANVATDKVVPPPKSRKEAHKYISGIYQSYSDKAGKSAQSRIQESLNLTGQNPQKISEEKSEKVLDKIILLLDCDLLFQY